MKRAFRVMAVVMICAGLSGCIATNTSVQGLLQAPKLPVELAEIKTILDQRYDSEIQYVTPVRGDNQHSTQQVDLDKDGEEEMVILHTLPRDPEPMRITILYRTSSGWKAGEDIKGVGSAIDQLLFEDMNNDGKLEILVGWQGGNHQKKALSVYEYSQSSSRLYKETSYTEFVIDDFTGDGTKELIVIDLDRTKVEASATLYDDDGGNLVFMDNVKMEGSANGYYNILSGLAAEGQVGLFVDTSYGAYSAFTDLLIWRNGQLENVLYDSRWGNMDRTKKAYPVESEDIDGDGIVEIATLKQPLGYEHIALAEQPWITSWHEWDGEDGLLPDGESYTDNRDGYRVVFPGRWKKRVTVVLDELVQDSVTFKYVDAYTNTHIPLLTIKTIDRAAYEAGVVTINEEREAYLDSTLEKVYVVRRYDLAEYPDFERMGVTLEEIQHLFDKGE